MKTSLWHLSPIARVTCVPLHPSELEQVARAHPEPLPPSLAGAKVWIRQGGNDIT